MTKKPHANHAVADVDLSDVANLIKTAIKIIRDLKK